MASISHHNGDGLAVLWLRRAAIALIPVLISALGLVWSDRAQRIEQLARNAHAIDLMSVRIAGVEKRVEDNKVIAVDDRREILEEIREMRKEVRALYQRATAGRGR